MTYTIESIDCRMPCVSHGRKIKTVGVNVGPTNFPVFDGSGKRWVTVADSSLHIIEGVAELVSSSSTSALVGKPKEAVPSGTRAIWGIPKSGAGYVADCGDSEFVIKTSKVSQSIAGCVLNVVTIGEHGVAIVLADGRVFLYVSEAGSIVGPLTLPGKASAIAVLHASGDSHHLLVSVANSLFAFDHTGRQVGVTGISLNSLSLSIEDPWVVQELLAIDSQTIVALFVHGGDGGLADTYTAVLNCAVSGGVFSSSVLGYSVNDVFISEVKHPARGYIRWIPEFQTLLISHSSADAVSLYRRDPKTSEFKCCIMPEGKQLGCALREGTAESTQVRGIFLAPLTTVGDIVTVGLAQSDGFLAIHTVEFPSDWRSGAPSTALGAAAPAGISVPSAAGSLGVQATPLPAQGFGGLFSQTASATTGSAFGGFGATAVPVAGSSPFGAFGSAIGNPLSKPVTNPPTGGLFAQAQAAVSNTSFGQTTPASISPFAALGQPTAQPPSAAGASFLVNAGATPSVFGILSAPTAGQPLTSSAPSGTQDGKPFAKMLDQPTGLGLFGSLGKTGGAAAEKLAEGQLSKAIEQPSEKAPEKPKAALPPNPFTMAKMASAPLAAPASTPLGKLTEPKTTTTSAPPAPIPPMPKVNLSAAFQVPRAEAADSSPAGVADVLNRESADISAEPTPPPVPPTVPELLSLWRERNCERPTPGDKELLNIFDALERELGFLEGLDYVCSVAVPRNVTGEAIETKMRGLMVGGKDLGSLEDECEEMNITVKPLFFGEGSLIETDSFVLDLRRKVGQVDKKISNCLRKAKDCKISAPEEWEIAGDVELPRHIGVIEARDDVEVTPPSSPSDLLKAPRISDHRGNLAAGLFSQSPLFSASLGDQSLRDIVAKKSTAAPLPQPSDSDSLKTTWQILRRIEGDAKKISALERKVRDISFGLGASSI